MNNRVQIVLFFNKNEFYKPSKIAALISEKIEEIGSPIILPVDGAPAEANFPIIVFSQNNKINLTSNFNNVSITLVDDMADKWKKIIENLYEIFDDNEFVRIGTVFTTILPEDKISDIKSETNCSESIIDSKDFKISWLTEIDINDTKVNMWKNYFSDKSQSNSIICVYDFNTKPQEIIDVSKDFAIKFIEQCKEKM
ncbi:MAG: hypothetical protein IJ966_04835 [Bacilli bacterium]|nr:hypothetical protein [Bacilli bacterium]